MQALTSPSPARPIHPFADLFNGLVRDLVLVLVSGALFAMMAVTTKNAMPQPPWTILLLVVPVLCMVVSLRRLQQSAWGVAGAGLLLLLTLCHPLMLYGVSSEPTSLAAVAALVLAATAVLDILQKPDAETRIHLGLFLAPLALLPGGWPTLLALAFLSPLTETRARAEVQVALGLLLVALVPAIIIPCAAWALQQAVPTAPAAAVVEAVYSTFALRSSFDATALKALTVTSLPLLAFMLPALREPEGRASAASVLLIPILIAAVSGTFEASLPPWIASLLAPLLVFLWSSGRRWPAPRRIALCCALAASALMAWQSNLPWGGSMWRERQMGQLPELRSQACTRIGACPAPLLRPTLPLS